MCVSRACASVHESLCVGVRACARVCVCISTRTCKCRLWVHMLHIPPLTPQLTFFHLVSPVCMYVCEQLCACVCICTRAGARRECTHTNVHVAVFFMTPGHPNSPMNSESTSFECSVLHDTKVLSSSVTAESEISPTILETWTRNKIGDGGG